jgi:hypothetical protein
MRAFVLVLKRIIAAMMVTGKVINILLVKPTTVATVIAQKAMCDKPSPMNENLLSTNVTPSNDEHRAIKIPTIKANCTN